MEYLNSYSYHLMDIILESKTINESQLETSFEKSNDKLEWYKRLLTNIKTMKTGIKHKIFAIVIPLLLSGGISQASIVDVTNTTDSDVAIEQYMDMGESEATTAGVQVYWDTTGVQLQNNNQVLEVTVLHDNTELYFRVSTIGSNPTRNVEVTLDGVTLYSDPNGVQLSQTGFYQDTVMANKGDVFKVSCTNQGYLNVSASMSADLTVGIETISETDFKIYPNPVQTELNVQTDQTDLTYEIYSMDGKLVLPQNQLSNSIDVSSLTKGYYILKLISEDGVVSKRFMKQ